MQFLRSLVLAAVVVGAAADFTALLNGQLYSGTNLRLRDVVLNNPNTPIVVTGTHITFKVTPATLTISDIALTGVADAGQKRLVTQPTVVYQSKAITGLTPAQIASPLIGDMRLRPNLFVLGIDVSGGSLGMEVTDSPQGVLIALEQGFTVPVEYTSVLAGDFNYFVNDFTGVVNVGNGINAVTPAQDPTNWHQIFLAKDAPLDTSVVQTYQDGKTTKWIADPDGELQTFFGRDVLEPRSANCNSACQATSKIWQSIPIPADPSEGWPQPEPQPSGTP